MSTSTSMPVNKLCCIRRKMHNNNNNNNDDNNTTTNNNLDCGWSLKLFLTGMWHSLASVALSALLILFALIGDAHGDSTRSLCSGSTWRTPRRFLARATITSNAMHSRQVPWAVGCGLWAVGRCVLSLCMLSALKWMALVVRVLGPC